MAGCDADTNVHPQSPFRFLKRWQNERCVSLRPADLHYAKHSRGKMHDAFAEISGSADVLLLCGDLTEYGLPEEAEELAADIRSAVRIPCIGVMVIMIMNPESRKPLRIFSIRPA
jgi:hypothetical protein